MDTARQNDIVLQAYDLAGDGADVHDLVQAIYRVCDYEAIPQGERPLEGRRERTTTRLRQAGMIERVGRGWRVTDTGRARLAEIDAEYEAVEAFVRGDH